MWCVWHLTLGGRGGAGSRDFIVDSCLVGGSGGGLSLTLE